MTCPWSHTAYRGSAGKWKQVCEAKSLHLSLEGPDLLPQPDWILQHLSLSLKNVKGDKFLNLLLSPQPHFSLTFHNSSSRRCRALKLKWISDVLLTHCPLPFPLSYRNSSRTLRSSVSNSSFKSLGISLWAGQSVYFMGWVKEISLLHDLILDLFLEGSRVPISHRHNSVSRFIANMLRWVAQLTR